MPDTLLADLAETSIPDELDYLLWENNTGPATGKLSVKRLLGFLFRHECKGRLTLTTGVPVTTADVTAASTLYWTPIDGGLLGLYDSTRWWATRQAELSLALTGLTADRLYDVFISYNAGTPALVLGTVWTNDTTRAVGLTTQDGIQVLSGTTTSRYVGTIRTTATTTTEDSLVKRFVWNKYNAVRRRMTSGAVVNSHTYNTAAWREWNAGTSSTRLQFVCGEAIPSMRLVAWVKGNCSGANPGFFGHGLDTVTVPEPVTGGLVSSVPSSHLTAVNMVTPVLGFHFVAICEFGNVTGATTFAEYVNAAAFMG